MLKRIILACIVFISFIVFFTPVFSQNANESFIKANSMLTLGNFEKAAAYYKMVIEQNPNNYEAYMGLGMAYKGSGKYQEAFDATSTAIKIKPNFYQAYYNLGLILEKQNKCSEAIDAFDVFLKEVPGADRFTDVKQRISKLKKGC